MRCLLSQIVQFGVFHDADEDCVSGHSHSDSASNRILESEEVPGRGLINDRDFRGALIILKRELPSMQEWHAERLEESRAGWHGEHVKAA